MNTPPKPHEPEPVWSRWIAYLLGGVPEVRTFDGSRVDVLTERYAIEVDWVKNWKTGPAQAVLYGAQLGREPAVILLTRGKPSEERYLHRAHTVCARIGVACWTWDTLVQPDATTIPRHVVGARQCKATM